MTVQLIDSLPITTCITYLQHCHGLCVVAILFNDASGLLQIGSFRVRLPPVYQVSGLIELTSLVIESVGNLVSNHKTNSSIVHVPGSVSAEELALQDASRELCKGEVIN